MAAFEVKHRGSEDPLIIIGAGHSGGKAAETLRSSGFNGRVVLIGEEPYLPYERPSLSKEFLRGASTGIETSFVQRLDFYNEAEIDLRLGLQVTQIDRRNQRVELANGDPIPYSKLILTTGARPRRLPIPGGEPSARVHYLRNFDDALKLRPHLVPGARLVVVGGGMIGLEVAATARQLACQVWVLESGDRVLGRAVSAEAAEHLARVHGENGVKILAGTSVVEIDASEAGVRLKTSCGEWLSADIIVVGIGCVPNDDLATHAGLASDDGILVDEYGQTDDPAIFAAGDATTHFNSFLGHRIRQENWLNAQNQAIAVARNMVSDPVPYAELPWFWTDQYDINMQVAGTVAGGSRLIRRGDPNSGSFSLLYLDSSSKLVGAISLNNSKDMRSLRRVMSRGGLVDPALLENASLSLDKVAKEHAQ